MSERTITVKITEQGHGQIAVTVTEDGRLLTIVAGPDGDDTIREAVLEALDG